MKKVLKHNVVMSLDVAVCGANHHYVVRTNNPAFNDSEQTRWADISFQQGPIQEAGVNGCQNEDLIAIVVDRLQSFQAADFKCRENAIAITKLEEALLWLGKRTQDRLERGVEGKYQV